MKKPLVSIITPCWGHALITEQYIENIAKTVDIDFELILVDNGNGVLDTHSKHKWLKIIKASHNLGFGGGNNLGVGQAQGRYLLFMNNDVLIHDPNWLKNLVEATDTTTISGQELVTDNMYTSVRGKLHPYINGWCMLMDRKIYDVVGGWDEGFGKGWFEDVYFSHVATIKGYQLKQVKVGIEHLGSRTITDGRLDTNKLMIHAGYYFRKKILEEIQEGKKMRIVFVVHGNYQFSDESFEGKGVGGSEASLILFSRELAKLGHLVEIYGNPETNGLNEHGVYYHHVDEFRETDYADVVILFRNVIGNISKLNAGSVIFWSCDQYTNADYNTFLIPFVDKVICISQFHKDYWLKTYTIKPEQIEVIDLGVNLMDYVGNVPKVKGQMIFCSVPHRGLDRMFALLPRIREQVPHANLVVTSDYSLWGGDPDNHMHVAKASEMEGLTFLGKVDRKTLVKYQNESQIMAYPCTYDENFCISAAECMAAGAVPISTKKGAVPTTVGMGGIIVDNDEEFITEVVSVLQNEDLARSLQIKAKIEAFARFNWELLAKQWEKLLYLERDKNMIDLLPRLTPFIPEESTVLDLGSGQMNSGISSQLPMIPFKRYVGVDIWDDYLEKTKKMALAAKESVFFKEDLLHYAEYNADKKFDFVFLFDVVEHFKKKDAKNLLHNVEKIAQKRILIFIPIGEHTLEANDGIIAVEHNPYQKHQSEWSVKEWQEMGYDVELLKGFHHGGILDAAWIMKDKGFEQICEECGQTYYSSYYFQRHKVEHGKGEGIIAPAADLSIKMPDVTIYLKKRIDFSVNTLTLNATNEIRVPYEQAADVKRIITDGYGADIIDREELMNK